MPYYPPPGAGGGVTLQAVTPGTPDTGHMNISGTGLFGGKLGVGIAAAPTIGALQVTGGDQFTNIPNWTSAIGRINSTTGWDGVGFLFSSSTANDAFSMVYSAGAAYFGNVTNSANDPWLSITSTAIRSHRSDTQFLSMDGNATNPGYSFVNNVDIGLYASSGYVYGAHGGVQNFAWGDGTFYTQGEISIGDGSLNNNPTKLRSRAANTLNIGPADSATPSNQSITVPGTRAGIDTDGGAAKLKLYGGLGTGAGASGRISFYTGTPQASGTDQHTAYETAYFANNGTSGVPDTLFWVYGDIISAEQILADDGDVSGPGFAFYNYPDMGFYSPASGQMLWATGGAAYVGFYAGQLSLFHNTLTMGGSSDLFITRRAAATVSLGAADDASPVAQTLTAQGARGGVDTNVAGATTTIQGSLGTGTGASGDLVFKTGTPQTTGTTQHVAATVLTLRDAGTGGTSIPTLVTGKLSVAPSGETVALTSSSTYTAGAQDNFTFTGPKYSGGTVTFVFDSTGQIGTDYGSLRFKLGSTAHVAVLANTVGVADVGHYKWSADANPAGGGGFDTGLKRLSAGVMQVTDGGSGMGKAKATSYIFGDGTEQTTAATGGSFDPVADPFVMAVS